MEVPPKKYFRLFPGGIVRLKGAYIIRCDSITNDAEGNISTIKCTYFPESKSGHDTSGLNPKGTIHWVNAASAVPIRVNEYDRLFKVENPSLEEGDFKEYINPDSLKKVMGYAEPSVADAGTDQHFQFIRKGYYCLDKLSGKELRFNRTVTLKDTWKG
jgi:glutaminyl-tRNA synthetase